MPYETSWPQNWAKRDLKKRIYSAIADKGTDGKTTIELARRSLGEDHGFPITQMIQVALHPKKFGQQKFNIYDGHSNSANHVHHYKQVMAL